jgi:hypothetical protein
MKTKKINRKVIKKQTKSYPENKQVNYDENKQRKLR